MYFDHISFPTPSSNTSQIYHPNFASSCFYKGSFVLSYSPGYMAIPWVWLTYQYPYTFNVSLLCEKQGFQDASFSLR